MNNIDVGGAGAGAGAGADAGAGDGIFKTFSLGASNAVKMGNDKDGGVGKGVSTRSGVICTTGSDTGNMVTFGR